MKTAAGKKGKKETLTEEEAKEMRRRENQKLLELLGIKKKEPRREE